MDIDLYKIARTMMQNAEPRPERRNPTLAHWVCLATDAEFVSNDVVRGTSGDVNAYVRDTHWVVNVRDRARRLLNLTEDEATALFTKHPTENEMNEALDYVQSAVYLEDTPCR